MQITFAAHKPIFMDINITTPALLFPAISLLLLAYTNRFLTLSSLIRSLKTQYINDHHPGKIKQIENLRRRVLLIRNMQACGIASFLMCVISMFALYVNHQLLANALFGVSLILLMVSLLISLREIMMSGNALAIELKDLEKL